MIETPPLLTSSHVWVVAAPGMRGAAAVAGAVLAKASSSRSRWRCWRSGGPWCVCHEDAEENIIEEFERDRQSEGLCTFESSHVLGVLLSSSPLLSRGGTPVWLLMGAVSSGFMHGDGRDRPWWRRMMARSRG